MPKNHHHANDRELQRRVLDALDASRDVEASCIGVAVRKGVVTLSGHVAHYAQKLAAEQLARRVAGVRALALHIEVRADEVAKTADDEIADRAVRLLAWDLMLPAGAVRVTVEHGVVELAGTVRWEHQRRDAERDVRRLHGVREVVNRLGLLPATEDAGAPPYAGFAHLPAFAARRISVRSVGDGTLVLEGQVRNHQERLEAEIAAWAAPGVTAIDNRLVVRA